MWASCSSPDSGAENRGASPAVAVRRFSCSDGPGMEGYGFGMVVRSLFGLGWLV